MVHTNGHLLCAIDVETTGSDPLLHEIFQLSVLPLNYDLTPLKSVLPFDIIIRPESPQNIDPRALKITKVKFADLMSHSMDRYTAMELFDEWFWRLNLPVTNGGHKMIMPLWSNGAFDKSFLMAFFGETLYQTYFYFHERDTQHTALYLNDRAFFHGDPIPFPKIGLSALATKFGIPTPNAHNSLADCVTTMEVYRELVRYQTSTIPGGYSFDSLESEPS